MAKQSKVVVTSFYAGGKEVWRAEWYEKLPDKKIQYWIDYLKEKGHEVNAVTDTTGRHISI